MQGNNRRRFIAGAVCPACGQLDKIVVEADGEQRLCVSCGFTEARPGVAGAGAVESQPELATRVSRAAARRVETPAQPVTLLDPGGPCRGPRR